MASPTHARARLALALLVGPILLAFGVIGGLLAINAVLWANLGDAWRSVVIVATFVVVGSLGYAMLALLRCPPDPPGEVEVPATAEPHLHALVEAIAADVGVQPPDRLVVAWDAGLELRELAGWFGLVRGPRTLVIGSGLFDVLDVTSLAAVVGHELGHGAPGATRLAPVALRTEGVLERVTQVLDGRVIGRAFAGYRRLQRRASLAARRSQDLVADHVMVRMVGRRSAAEGLRAVRVAVAARRLLVGDYVEPLLSHDRRPDDLHRWLRVLLADPAVLQRLDESVRAVPELVEPPDQLATHRPLGERIAQIAAVADDRPPRQIDQRPLRSLLTSPDRWTRLAEDRWWRPTGAEPVPKPIIWEDWAELVITAAHREQAADTDGVLTDLGLPTGPAGMMEVLRTGRGGDLAGGLVAIGWRPAPPEERADGALAFNADPLGSGLLGTGRMAVRAALTAVLATQAVDHGGCRWSMVGTEPVLIGRGRTVVRLTERVDAALNGDWSDVVPSPAPAPPAPSPAPVAAPPPPAPTAATTPPTAAPTPSPVPPPASPPPTTPQVTPATPPSAPGTPARLPIGDRARIPKPPMPPFRSGPTGWLWHVQLPSKVGSRAVVRIGAEELGFGRADVAYRTITSVAIGSQPEPGKGWSARIELTRADGKPVTWKAVASGAEQRSLLLTGLTYLREVLDTAVAPRLRAEIVDRVSGGETVEVGGLLLSPSGVAPRGKPHLNVGWSGLRDPEPVDDGHTAIGTPSGYPLVAGIDRPNGFLLPELIGELRSRHA